MLLIIIKKKKLTIFIILLKTLQSLQDKFNIIKYDLDESCTFIDNKIDELSRYISTRKKT